MEDAGGSRGIDYTSVVVIFLSHKIHMMK